MEAVQKNVAAVIAKELQPHLRKSGIQTTPVVVLSADSKNASTSSDSSANEECYDTFSPNNTFSETSVLVSDNNEEVTTINDDVAVAEEVVGLLSVSEVTQIYVRSCSRGNMASKLVRRLVDETTRMTSNVNGRGKKQLDPDIIAYVKSKCFEFFPSTGSDRVKEEWAKCILAIDESCRRLNKSKKNIEKPGERSA